MEQVLGGNKQVLTGPRGGKYVLIKRNGKIKKLYINQICAK